jgi:ribosomal protein S18 acetylase RimI-like enzyme
MILDHIAYRDSHAAIDILQLGNLFVTAGWPWRAADPAKLAAIVEGSRYVVSAHDEAAGSLLVGFARAISDGVTNAYVSTVAVLPEYRRKGIGAELVKRLVDGKDSIRFLLHAKPDVQDFYRKLGFEDATGMLRRDRRS